MVNHHVPANRLFPENLQKAMEDQITRDPKGFAEMERDPEAFADWAYETHADAYIEGGLNNLSGGDLWSIANEPDIKDLANPSGVGQIIETGAKYIDKEIDKVERTFLQAVTSFEDKIIRRAEW